ncbi:hypothetical protein B0J13DRAFT_649137 [Dactylonectria estremocensis]|uniref:Rhodopsin domain-containing protein n=1 Tax=Dactylonectria estremocensis TaxID=1079267 RepID=A0A9P9DGV4_9HYPO|nr:hypothetical protein B0J13DRAFT_649137 [Dactylonectria estremocensis]
MSSDSYAAPAFYALTENNRAGLVVVASIVFLVYAILGTLTKLLIRLNITSMRDYDYSLLFALVLYFAQTACVVAACNRGLGVHRDDITADDFERYGKLMYASRILAPFISGAAKISLCLLIRQIDNQGKLNTANIALGGLVLVWVVTGFFSIVFQCPLPTPWLAESYAQCTNYGPIYVYNGIMDILTDLALCILPVAMMWHVQTTPRRKAIVMGLFGTRIIVPIVTIPSLTNAHYLFQDYSDPTWLAVSRTIWFQISLGLSVLTVCIPSLKGVIDSLLGSTAVAAIQAPYDLKSSDKRSGLELTLIPDSSKNASHNIISGGGRLKMSSKGKSADRSGWQSVDRSGWHSDRETATKRGGSERMSGSESVRKLTEGVIVVRDEFEIHYDEGRASTSRAGSHGSSDAGYRM